MSGLRPDHVAAIARELTTHRGDRVRAVHQDGPRAFRVALDGRAGRVDLVLDISSEFPRLHLADARPAPTTPSPLAASLRNHLMRAKLVRAEPVAGERAVALVFERGGITVTLWYEGFGRGANLYLVDAEGRVLLTPRGDVAARREARVGHVHRPVPPKEVAPPAEDSGSAEVAALALEHEQARETEQLRTRLRRALSRRRERATRQLAALDEMATRGQDADRLEREGELLRTSFHLLRPGLDRVVVPDHERGGDVAIELDPKRPPGEQVGKRFRRARRARRAAEEAAARLPAAREALAEAEAAIDVVEAAPGLAALEPLARSLSVRTTPGPRPQKGPVRARPWREFRSRDGWPIRVGRDARGNDQLTLHHARPHDLFLHVRGGRGSHVVVPTPRGKTVPRDTLLDAAELAAFFSDRRGATAVEVDYVPRRHVRKRRGAPPGEVMVERARTIALRPNESRRRRVLSTRQAPQGGSPSE